MAKTIFNVTKAKPDAKNPEKKFFCHIGKIVIHESGKSGVLFLNMLDGEFPLFLNEKKGDEKNGDDAESNGSK